MSSRARTLLAHLCRLVSPADSDAVLLARWQERRDEDAFAAMVARHGPMVLGVCRRVLGDAHTAEDAFQATFLVLARKADRVRRPEALPSFLYGVALRLARKTRAAARQRMASYNKKLDLNSKKQRAVELQDAYTRHQTAIVARHCWISFCDQSCRGILGCKTRSEPCVKRVFPSRSPSA